MAETQDQDESRKRWAAAILTWAGIAGGCLLLATVAALMIAGYIFHLTWTGVVPEPKDPKHIPGKTLWDWLQLLIIPAALAVVGIWFNGRQKQYELEIAQRNREADRQIADRNRQSDMETADRNRKADLEIADRNRQADLEKAEAQRQEQVLATYIDRMSALMTRLADHAQTSESPDSYRDAIRAEARARTVTAIRQLNSERNASLLRFLAESRLLTSNGAPIDLGETDLRDSQLAEVNLSHANLAKANLEGANLQRAALWGANLAKAHLMRANLQGAALGQADLRRAFMLRANLDSADMREAKVEYAFLQEAHLRRAWIADDQLIEAEDLAGATMPDSRKFQGWGGQSYEYHPPDWTDEPESSSE